MVNPMSRGKKNRNENRTGHSEATSLSFNRLGAILRDIAQSDTSADMLERDNCHQAQKQQSKLKLKNKKGGKNEDTR